jgi:hypothetical protein
MKVFVTLGGGAGLSRQDTVARGLEAADAT